MDNLQILKNANLKATPQRLAILKVLKTHIHPNIDELYEEIKKENPSISLATVYKNLDTLVESKIAIEINTPNLKTKYDIYEHPHAHVVCQKCGFTQDLMDDVSNIVKYQNQLEEKIGKNIDNFIVVATIDGCQNCS